MEKNEMYTEYGYRGTAELQQEKDRNKKLVEENKKLVEANDRLTENLRKSEEHYTT